MGGRVNGQRNNPPNSTIIPKRKTKTNPLSYKNVPTHIQSTSYSLPYLQQPKLMDTTEEIKEEQKNETHNQFNF